jgi:hypothetical protein
MFVQKIMKDNARRSVVPGASGGVVRLHVWLQWSLAVRRCTLTGRTVLSSGRSKDGTSALIGVHPVYPVKKQYALFDKTFVRNESYL